MSGTVRKTCAVSMLVCAALAGCTTYRYAGAEYHSREGAIAAARADTDQFVAGVTPSSERIGGSLLIVVPPKLVLQQQGIVVPMGGTPPSAETIDYIAELSDMRLASMADVVRKGGAFDSVTLVHSTDPENEPFGDRPYKLWLQAKFLQNQWYISERGSTDMQPVYMDRGLPKEQQGNSFNASVMKAVAKLRSSAGTAAASGGR